MRQEAVRLVGENQLLHIHLLLPQILHQTNTFLKRNIGVVVAVIYVVLIFAPLQRRKRPAPVLPPGEGDPLPVTTSPAT